MQTAETSAACFLLQMPVLKCMVHYAYGWLQSSLADYLFRDAVMHCLPGNLTQTIEIGPYIFEQ